MLLVTGATGYIGGRLLARLEREDYRVRCLCRRPAALLDTAGELTEVIQGDLCDARSLPPAFAGVSTAVYLVHSMASAKDFEERERLAAGNFAAAASKAGVRRIVYLGGLAQDSELSPHFRSRRATGDILRSSGIPVIEFRASIVIGAGSVSFEMIRSLVEHLPVMIAPKWVNTPAQPLAVEDAVEYLAAAVALPEQGGCVFEIGGADVDSYAGIMREYARQRALRRWIIRVPLLTPWLSSLWLSLVTPLYARIGRRLIESVRTPSVVRDPSALEVFPIRPVGIAQAIRQALAGEDRGPGNLIVDSREIRVPVAPEAAFTPVRRIGGKAGWYYGNWLWRMRGFLDLLAGGVGMRRGRPDPDYPLPGSTLDFWKVEAYEPDRLLRLSADMKVPGRAWLEFRVKPEGAGSVIRQTAEFEPRGLTGLLYWYALYPAHWLIFRGMLRRLAAAAVHPATGSNDINESSKE